MHPKSFRQLLSIPLLSAVLVAAGCASTAAKPETSLYQRLGGIEAITAVVDDFVANVADDSRINARFANTDIPKLKRLLVEQNLQRHRRTLHLHRPRHEDHACWHGDHRRGVRCPGRGPGSEPGQVQGTGRGEGGAARDPRPHEGRHRGARGLSTPLAAPGPEERPGTARILLFLPSENGSVWGRSPFEPGRVTF